METRNRYYYFDNLKAFLIISVIIGNSLELANPTSVNTHFFILFLYIFHMPLFAFVSGYFSRQSKRSTKQKVKDTFKLYIYAQIFYTFFNYFILGKDHVKVEFLIPQWTLWYLLSLIFWYIISDYINGYKKWIVGSILLSIFLGLDNSIGTTGSVSRTIFFLPFFIAGNMFKLKYINIIKIHKKKILLSGLFISILLFLLSDVTPIELFFEYTNYTWYFERPWFPMFMRVFHYGASIIIGLIILMYIPNNKNVFSQIGKYSLIMYLSHSGISQLLIHFDLVNYTSLIKTVVSTFFVVLSVITFSYIFVKAKETKGVILKSRYSIEA